MKIKLIFLLVCVYVGLFAADNATYRMNIKSNGFPYTWASTSTSAPSAQRIPAFTSADSISNNDSIYNIPFNPNSDYPYEYYIRLVLDSISGTPTLDSIILQGKMFSSDSWTDIGSNQTWAGTDGDTTIIFNGLVSSNTSTFTFDTTKTNYGDTLVLTMDTTKYYTGDGDLSNKRLYEGTISRFLAKTFYTGTLTQTLPAYTKYRLLRIHIKCNSTTAQHTRPSELEIKFLY
jgi:hypothetical protein